MAYLAHVAVIVLIGYVIAAAADLVIGRSGILCLAPAVFWGCGAYAAAIAQNDHGASLLAGIVIGGLAGIASGCAVGFAVTLLRGDRLAIATFACQLIFLGVLNNSTRWTGGPGGINSIGRDSTASQILQGPAQWILVILPIAVTVAWLTKRMAASPIGRVWTAIREDEKLLVAMGRDTVRFKLEAFGLSGFASGVAGAVYANYITFIDPTGFDVGQSVLILSMVIVGGPATLLGPLVGATLLLGVPELLRLGVSSGPIGANVRQILYAVLLLWAIVNRPRPSSPARRDDGVSLC